MKAEQIEFYCKWFNEVCDEIKDSWILPVNCRGGTVIDCGSCVGGFPTVFNARFDRYICYEANPLNLSFSKHALQNVSEYNIAEQQKERKFRKFLKDEKKTDLPNPIDGTYNYNLYQSCVFENKACHGTEGIKVPIYNHLNNCPGDCSIYLSDNHVEKNLVAHVPTITYDQIREKYYCEKCQDPIELLKCDIEGAEYDFLIDKDLSIFKFILLELHYRKEDSKYSEILNLIKKTHDIVGTSECDVLIMASLKSEFYYKNNSKHK
tara:strand:+ start:383 stop:1174 length:792 start_codon:yes stop_codon:yes gene_type:complete